MSESEKRGPLAKAFGGTLSFCCSLRIEGMPEEATQKQDGQCPLSCCGGADAVPNDASQANSDAASINKEG